MSAETTHGQAAHSLSAPDIEVDAKKLFGLNIDLKVPAFQQRQLMCLLWIPIISLIMIRPWQSWLVFHITGALWFRAIMALANQLTLNRSLPA